MGWGEVIKNISHMKVLVADDNQINLFIVNEILNRYKIEADLVNNGAECVAKCKNVRYDLIFMDHMMPDMDGVEAFKQLRLQEGFDTPVIVLTANIGEEAAAEYKRIGFDKYLEKPIDPDKVEEVIREYSGAYKICDTINELDEATEEKRRALIRNGFGIVDDLLEAGITIEDYEVMLEIFSEESAEKLEEAGRYFEEMNMREYAVIVHGLKNDAAMISDMELSEHAKQHEIASKSGDEAFVRKDWPALSARWQNTLDRVKNYLKK